MSGTAASGKPFKKGEDPRRKKSPRKGTAIPDDIKAAFQELAPEAIKTIKDVMKGKSSQSARIAAAQVALDRGFGKVPQDINANLGGEVKVNVSVNFEKPKGENGSGNSD
jgi:hypothetical protein